MSGKLQCLGTYSVWVSTVSGNPRSPGTAHCLESAHYQGTNTVLERHTVWELHTVGEPKLSGKFTLSENCTLSGNDTLSAYLFSDKVGVKRKPKTKPIIVKYPVIFRNFAKHKENIKSTFGWVKLTTKL